MTVLITGHSGFVGRALVKTLKNENLILVGRHLPHEQTCKFFQKSLDANTDFSECFSGVSVIIHMAARVHVMDDNSKDPIAAYRETNVAGTLKLATQAAAHGVKRFIFISSVKVNGESTSASVPFTPFDSVPPTDPYGISKYEAEEALKILVKDTGMEVVIIRPPLVYGLGVKANFAAMMNLAKKNLPLPLGAIGNKRSLVALDNLVDLIVACIGHPNAANQTFLVSDDQDVSTTELLQMMTRAAGKKPMLLPIPVSWLKLAGKLTGKQAIIDRLCGNLQVDITHTKNTLGWKPPITVEQGIQRCFIKEELC